MARYIDADQLAEYITTNYCMNCDIYDGEKCNSCLMNDALNFIETFQSADVVPKSEVDLYRKQVDELEDELASTYDKLEDAKSEVEKIFAEIESKIIAEIDRNNGVLVEFEDADELYHRIKGEVYALCEIQDFSAELKKKYTEEK